MKKKKTELFFSQFFSKDTIQHKTAVKNLHIIQVDSTDFLQVKRGIESLSWKEKKYLEVKKDLIERGF